jgi:hypothetical protein
LTWNDGSQSRLKVAHEYLIENDGLYRMGLAAAPISLIIAVAATIAVFILTPPQRPDELAYRLLLLFAPDLGKIASDIEQHPLVRRDLARTILTKTFKKIGQWHAQRAGNLK